MPGVRGLNHLTLSVAQLDRAIHFYRDVLGMNLDAEWPEGAYLSAGKLWLCLTVDPDARRAPLDEYTHVAFDVAPEDFSALVERIEAAGAPAWKDNISEGASHYFLDPDGHKLEIHIGDLSSRLDDYRRRGLAGMEISP